jgi:nucleoside-diphosphate-sugar epimerase
MKVSIIGLGWFGEALGDALRAKYDILGTTRSETKASHLRGKGFDCFVLNYPQIPSPELLAVETIVLNIPPREEHLDWFKSWPWMEGTQLILISSTSVYGDQQGIVDENTVPDPDTESGKILVEQEKYFLGFKNSVIIRFGGLFGAGRHPGKFLSGRKNLEGANRPVNLIHQKDTVGFVKLIIENNFGGTFNLVHPDHPSRETYYQDYCHRHQLALPEFTPATSTFKVINSSKVPGLYQFQTTLSDD